MKSSLQKLKRAHVNYKGLLIAFLLISLLLVLGFYFFETTKLSPLKQTIKVGVLFSSTGMMADTERPALRASLLAIEEINQKGGVQGMLLEPVVYDPGSNWKRTAQLAQKMIEKDKVVVIFGCFTSAARKEVKEIVEKFDNLLIFPVSYAGIEESKNIIYLGMAPNQQLIPSVSWIVEQKSQKVYLVGSDYIWPHTANEIIAHQIKAMGSQVIAVKYLRLGETQVDALIDDIIAKKPDFIYSTIIGTSNIAFLNRIYDKIPIDKMPHIMSFGIIPNESFSDKKSRFIGLHSVWSYYRSLDNPENKAFLEAYKKKYGSNFEVDDPAATIYTGVQIWAQTLYEYPDPNPIKMRENMLRQSIASPAGVIYIDPYVGSAWRSVHIEKVNQEGLREIVWSSDAPIEPIIYPEFKTKAEWDLFQYKLFIGWGNAWGEI